MSVCGGGHKQHSTIYYDGVHKNNQINNTDFIIGIVFLFFFLTPNVSSCIVLGLEDDISAE